jgi:hypothetical protein
MSFQLGRIELAPASLPPPAAPDPMIEGFRTVVDRLQEVIEFETNALSRHIAIDLGELNRKKRHGMLELSRLLRGFGDGAPEEIRDRMTELGAALERNRAVLEVQLGAMREIADIIAQVMRDAEWDGTYSIRAGRP